MADVRPQVLIDGDHARLGQDAGRLQVQRPDAGGPADREEHRVGGGLAEGLAAAVVNVDGARLPVQAGDEGVGRERHPAGAEGAAELGRYVRVGRRAEPGPPRTG